MIQWPAKPQVSLFYYVFMEINSHGSACGASGWLLEADKLLCRNLLSGRVNGCCSPTLAFATVLASECTLGSLTAQPLAGSATT